MESEDKQRLLVVGNCLNLEESIATSFNDLRNAKDEQSRKAIVEQIRTKVDQFNHAFAELVKLYGME